MEQLFTDGVAVAGGVVRSGNRDDRPGIAAEHPPRLAEQPARLRRADRRQMILEPLNLDERLPADHEARMVWAVVERLDVSGFEALIKARGSLAGRPATDPRLLIALLLLGAVQGIGSARRLARLCQTDDGYRWLLGGVTVNHHDLSDFRVGHEKHIDGLLTQLIACLMETGLVEVRRISQDGTRIRACAGRGSFSRRSTLEKLLVQARVHVEELKRQSDDPGGEAALEARTRAARERAARERQERIEAALEAMKQLEAVKQNPTGKPSKNAAPRASTTDAEARKMKTGTGAILPAWNVQLAVDTASRAIVGVMVGNSGSDGQYLNPMREQVEERTGRTVAEHLADGGYFNKEQIEQAHQAGVTTFIPPAKEKNPATDPSSPKRGDKEGVMALRKRMVEAATKGIYKQRASTSETANGELTCYRGLGRMLVRGADKVRCVALWSVLAYNVVHFAGQLTCFAGQLT